MDNNSKIGNMDALLFALALETSLLQIQILERSANLSIQKQAPFAEIMKDRDKTLLDRQMVKDVLRATLLEISEHGEWPTLRRAKDVLEKRAEGVHKARAIYDQLRKHRETTVNDLTTKRNSWITDLYDADKNIAYLRDKLKNEQLNSNARISYAEKWLAAREESLELQSHPTQQHLPSIEHEQRVHESLLKAYELQTKNYEDTLEYWCKRYANDTADINKRLVEKKENLLNIMTRRNELQKQYDLHEGEMRSWLTFKHERALRLQREERRRKAATNIQAWWRGVMVRRCLGQFRYLRNAKKSPTKTKKK